MSVEKKVRYSIIIPTYNRFFMVSECLQGLCAQLKDYTQAEIMVLNDGGEEDVSWSRRFPPVHFFYSPHVGPAAARNFCIHRAKGDVIIFLDDDSVPCPNWFESMGKAWHEFPDADGIGGYIGTDYRGSCWARVNADIFNWYLEESIIGGTSSFLSTCNASYKKSILYAAGGFDERFKYACGEDRDLNNKILRLGGRLILDKRIMVYHDSSLPLRGFLKRHFRYGKAAHQLYILNSRCKKLSPSSHLNFLKLVFKKYVKFSDKVTTIFLWSVSQIVTAAGYLSAILTRNAQHSYGEPK